MSRQLRGHTHCIDGVLDVDWGISLSEDAHFLRDAEALEVSYDDQLRHLATHCLIKVDPEFPLKVQPGDFLVGNRERLSVFNYKLPAKGRVEVRRFSAGHTGHVFDIF